MKLSDYEYYRTELGAFYNEDTLKILKLMPDESVNCVMTSPPYWALRDYGNKKQIGLEKTFQEYIDKLIQIFNEVKRILKKDGTCWVNLGDTYNNPGSHSGKMNEEAKSMYPAFESGGYTNLITKELPGKSLCQIPSRFSIAMTDAGWILRNEIIWYKKNCMPSSAKDRFTVDFEKLFFFVKNKKYWFEQQFEKSVDPESYTGRNSRNSMSDEYIKQTGHKNCSDVPEGKIYPERNKRAVWQINPQPYPESHFAVFPESLVETPIKAGCPKDGIIADIFMGSGTVAMVAEKLGYKWIGIELNKEYCKIAMNRIKVEAEDKPIKMEGII